MNKSLLAVSLLLVGFIATVDAYGQSSGITDTQTTPNSGTQGSVNTKAGQMGSGSTSNSTPTSGSSRPFYENKQGISNPAGTTNVDPQTNPTLRGSATGAENRGQTGLGTPTQSGTSGQTINNQNPSQTGQSNQNRGNSAVRGFW